MVSKAFKTILYFVIVLPICLTCSMSFADTTPELEIIKVNNISIYVIPANQLVSEAKKRNIPVIENNFSDGHIDYTIEDSRLSDELFRLYNRAISKSQESKDEVIIEYNARDSDNIIELIQVNKARCLITGIRFLRK